MTLLNSDKLPVRMSFSMFWASRKCPASGLPVRAVQADLSDLDSQGRVPVVLGMFFHSLIKAVSKRRKLDTNQKEAVRVTFPEVVQKYNDRYPDVNLDYEPIVQRIFDTVREHVDFGFDDQAELKVEEEILSNDSLLYGQPDWVLVDNDGVQLIDFKLTTDQDKLRTDRYFSQIKFYAYLVSEAYGQLPAKCSLVGLLGTQLEVPVVPDDVLRIADDARAHLTTIRSAAERNAALEDLAIPDPVTCHGCRYNGVCEARVGIR